MFLRPDVIAWAFVWMFCIGPRSVSSAPTSAFTSDATSTSFGPRQTSNPYPYGDSGDNSSPMTTIVIVCVVGALALLGAAWGFYSCMVARRTPKIASVAVAGGTNTEPTTLIYIPGEQPAMAALPSLRYNAPSILSQRDPETTEVGPGVILPPPPSYDVAMGGKPPQMTESGEPFPYRLKRERTDSRWKDLLVSQGRD